MSTKGTNRIEKGCLAIIVNSAAGNNGTCVQVLEFIGDIKGFMHKRQWRIDTEIKTITKVYGKPPIEGYANHCAESRLLRIDDYQPENESQDTKIPEEA